LEARDNGGREGYGRRKGKEREVGVLNGREVGELKENYATMLNISQAKPKKKERKPGMKCTGNGVFDSLPCNAIVALLFVRFEKHFVIK